MRITRLLLVGAAALVFGCIAVGCGNSGGNGGGNGGGDGGGSVNHDGGGSGNDGGNPTDGGSFTDAGNPSDGGGFTDGGNPTDGGTPSDGGTCAGTPCTIVAPQCGCSGTNACYPQSSTAHVCAPAGATTEGKSCAHMNDCAAGLGCLNIAQSGTPLGACERFCNGDGDCQGAGSLCVHTVTDKTGATVATVCSLACDPIAQTGCESGADCIIAAKPSGTPVYFTDCVAPVGTGTQGQSCSGVAACAPGYGCAGNPGHCMKYCTAPGQKGAGGCSASQTCQGFSTGITIGGTSYGVCN